MGEPTCLMHPFSYASGFANEASEGNPIHALGQSVSFGRFTAESLSWEKWSTFPHKRYVEEAERYTRPGSVAEKKAFFEAHYKKMAAKKKAAELLEQATSASDITHEHENGNEVDSISTSNAQNMIPAPPVSLLEQKELKETNGKDDSVLCLGKYMSNVGKYEPKSDGTGEAKRAGKDQISEKKSLDVQFPTQLRDVIDHKQVTEVEFSETLTDEKSPLKNVNYDQEALEYVIKKRTENSLSKSRIYGRASGTSNQNKENNATPVNKFSAVDLVDKKKPTPRSIYKSITSTPAREFNKLTSTIIRKIDGSIAGVTPRASKDSSTPLKTPTMASKVRAHTSATPRSEARSGKIKTPIDASSSKSKTIGSKWRFLSAEKKSQSQLLSSPFRLRTEERAARRKQKLEEKFNSNDSEKVQLQTRLKKKAETELRKLRQTLCFRARPLPDFYRERGATCNENDAKKVPLAHSQTTKLGKKPPTGTLEGKTSQLPQRPPMKRTGSRHVLEKKCRNPMWSPALKSMMTTRENKSPNIQQQ